MYGHVVRVGTSKEFYAKRSRVQPLLLAFSLPVKKLLLTFSYKKYIHLTIL